MRFFTAAALTLLSPLVLSAPIESTFNSTLEDWTATNFVTFEWRNDDGNPAGYLYLDNNEAGLAYIFAPAKFRGDLSAYNGGTIFFDGKLLGTGGSFYNNTNFDYGSIRISNGALTATLDLLPGGATAPTGGWQTYQAPLTASAWGKSENDWATLLSNVTEIRIGLEALFGNEIQGIDNVRIDAVPLPGAAWLLGTALLATVSRARRRPGG
jgi:hypothetical protein